MTKKIDSLKPTVFFSHSSRDRDLLMPIRAKLDELTGRSIEIFMSSDGGSIPFGHNWIKVVEDGLKNCSLMFVWMTPSSRSSRWIPFEAGYAYSRGIEVVPLGFQGTKLDEIGPPLGLLQGFDISSSEGLNNLVSIINKKFDRTFLTGFDEAFYRGASLGNDNESSAAILDYVDKVLISFYREVSNFSTGLKATMVDDPTRVVEETLRGLRIEFSRREKEFIIGTGFKISWVREMTSGPPHPVMLIDPVAVNTLLPLILSLGRDLYHNGRRDNIYMELLPVRGLEFPADNSTVSARLLNSDVSFDSSVPHFVYRYHNVEFIPSTTTDENYRTVPSLRVFVGLDNTSPLPLVPLFEMLLQRRVLKQRTVT